MRDSLAIPDEFRAHGVIPPRGGQRLTLSPLHEGRFGRMFRKLSPATHLDDAQLIALAETMRDTDAPSGWNGSPAPRDNPAIPAGYTYLGQFIDHDITFDPASSLQRQNDIDALVDFRSTRFDLDSIYGSGPADEPFQYVRKSKGLALLVEPNRNGMEDLPRNSEDVALIGDPRNDENIIVSQLQLLFLKLHNRIGGEVRDDPAVPADAKFETAQQRVRWLYQWVVLFDYVRRIVGPDTFKDIVQRKRGGAINIVRPLYEPRNNAYMPIEFSVAAFRFGHSMIRGIYDLNSVVKERPIFLPGPLVDEFADLRGFRRLPQAWTADWPLFFEIDGSTPQPSRLIDGRVVPALFDLPTVEDGSPSLPVRNLLRGQRLDLPGGQDVAKRVGVQVLSGAELGAPEPTPLWFYLLREAELLGDGGKHLGPVGGAIVGQVLAGILELDPTGWLKLQPDWTPPHPAGTDFDMADLVQYALGQ